MTNVRSGKRRVRGAALALCLASAATALAACGTSPSTQSGADTDKVTDEAGISADVKSYLTELYAGTASEPSGEPVPAESGKSIYIVSCGQGLPVCAEMVGAAEEAAKTIGWTTDVYDTQTDPAKFGLGVNQGIATRPDAMLLVSIDCALAKNQVQSALDAGIKIMTLQSIDCSDSAGGGGPSLYTNAEPKIAGFDTFADWNREWSAQRVLWVAAKTESKGNILQLDEPEYPLYVSSTEGAATGFEKYCPDCEVTHLQYSFAEAGAKLQQKVQQALLKNPDINVVMAPDGATVLSGVSAAVQASGKDILVVAGGGEEASFDLIRSGNGLDAAFALDLEWWGWAAIDSLNSLFEGQPIRDSGLGTQLIDGSNIWPSGGYENPIDFKTAYKKLWEVS